MATTTNNYLRLTSTFPPRVIRTEADYRRTLDVVAAMMRKGEKLSADERDFLETLSIVVEQYEARQRTEDHATVGEMLDHLIEARGTTQAAVAQATGIPAATLSNIRAGRRGLSKANITKLATFFHVPAVVWLATQAD